MHSNKIERAPFFDSVKHTIELAIELSAALPIERRAKLDLIKVYFQASMAENKTPQLVFICTHNSRRSHYGQIWAKVMADYFGYPRVKTYSGGTEATAFNPNAIAALKQQGFKLSCEDEQIDNPIYTAQYGSDFQLSPIYSKKYDAPQNPSADFCAIMTCTEADEACPIVFGASSRVSLPYEDPKKSDGTALQNATYQKRSLEIASEMAYLFANI
ncbi:MAG: protein-tyrosine-phosphatase [Bacteroidia bacterium]